MPTTRRCAAIPPRSADIRSHAGRALSLILPLGFLLYLLARPGVSIPAAREGLSLWAFAVLPSLLPFATGTLLLRESGALELLSPALAFLPRLLGLPRCCAATILAGWLSGYPVGARLTAGLLAEGRVTPSEAQRLLQLTSTASPVFMLGTVGVAFFGNPRAGLALMIAHLIGAMILCRATKPRRARGDAARGTDTGGSGTPPTPKHRPNPVPPQRSGGSRGNIPLVGPGQSPGRRRSGETPAPSSSPSPLPFAAALARALQESALLQLPVAASIAIAFVLLTALPQGLAALPLARGVVEMSTGAKAAADAGLGFLPRLCMAAFSLGFGGLAILAQTTVAINGSGLRLSRLVLDKVMHAGLATALTALIAPALCGGAAQASAFPMAFPLSVVVGVWLAMCGIAAICSLRKHESGTKRGS